MMTYQTLLWEQKDTILLLTLNRPQKLNALNEALLAELHTAFTTALADSTIRGIIITGAGQKAFAAGADIAEFQGLTPDKALNLAAKAQTNVFDLIETGEKPVIAAINGYALGGGLELAMACHIRLASENAVMGLPELSLGIIPAFGGTQRLTHLVGKGRAFELILSSGQISASQALEIGLVNNVTTSEALLTRSEQVMKEMLKNPPHAVASAIKAIHAAFTPGGFETEMNAFASCFAGTEPAEGIRAFLEKRKPDPGKNQ